MKDCFRQLYSQNSFKKVRMHAPLLIFLPYFPSVDLLNSFLSLRVSVNYTAKNPVISPNFLVWKFCGKAQFPHSFGG